MSVSKWAYIPAKCDGDFCVGDCDECPKAEENMAEREEEHDERPQSWNLPNVRGW